MFRSNPGNIPSQVSGVVFEEFTTSGIWNKPTGAIFSYVENIGGGAGGGNRTTAGETGGGGGGEGVSLFIEASDLAATETVTIGAGGTGGANGGSNNGADGGDTTFGTLLTARGGIGGKSSSMSSITDFQSGKFSFGGGVVSPNFVQSNGTNGTGGFSCGSGGNGIGPGGGCFLGGAGGGGTEGSDGYAGGVSENGGDGGAGVGTAATPGVDGSSAGGGGGGSSNNGGGGDGAAGRVRIWTVLG